MSDPTATPSDVASAVPSPVNGQVLAPGAHEGNTGGKPGRSGRKSNEWLEAIDKSLADPAALDAIKTVLNDPNHKHYASVLKTLSGYIVPRLLRLDGATTAASQVVFVIPENGRAAPSVDAQPSE